MDSERARQRLSEERSRVEEALAALTDEPSSDEPQEADRGAELEQTERDEALREDLIETLEAIGRAERRLEEGTYGVSVSSGEPIPDARLEAVPWAERTVEEEGGGR